ncbi:MAG TPA: thiol reductant ABC exporter subunit CydD [Aldersonia sp.]
MSVTAAPAPERRRRPPIDPRLWRYCVPARRYLVVTVLLSLVVTAAIVVSATMIGTVLGGVITDGGRRTLADWAVPLVVLTIALAVRVGASWLQARYGDRVATQVIAQLQGDVLDAAVGRSPRELDTQRNEAATVLTKGMADLRPYLSGYVPALLLSVIVPPIVLITIALQDVVSALIIAFTLPLIPVFMILIGLLTRGRAQQTLAAMTTLSAQLLDLLAGLPTLRALGRERGPQDRVAELGESHRQRAMSALRIAFLSGMVLELLATLCVALVAVSIGLRLVFGEMALTAGIIALILAPEVYQPLRTVGERFHAAEDGLAAADRAFTLLDEHGAVSVGDVRPSSFRGRIMLRGLGIASRDGMAPDGLSADCAPGVVTVLTGPNGSGKSTALQAILGLVSPDVGSVAVDECDVADLDRDWWWQRVAWLPQRPVVLAGTLRENLELVGAPGADPVAAAEASGFDDVLRELPSGWDTVVGTGGVGLSLGQRQRLALTRVLSSGKPVLLLDEPTAHLDAQSEARVLAALRRRAAEGATVVVVGHRPAVLAAGDVVVRVGTDG